MGDQLQMLSTAWLLYAALIRHLACAREKKTETGALSSLSLSHSFSLGLSVSRSMSLSTMEELLLPLPHDLQASPPLLAPPATPPHRSPSTLPPSQRRRLLCCPVVVPLHLEAAATRGQTTTDCPEVAKACAGVR